MIKKPLIRNATNSDSASILELIFDIWHNEYHFAVNKDDVPDLQNIETHYPKGSSLFLVAFESEMLIGSIACSKLSEDQWALKRMFVKKSHRRKGVAQSLFNTLLTKLPGLTNHNKSSLFLSTKANDAVSAKAFYLKNEFEVILKSSLPANFPYFYEDDLFMMRKII